MEFYRIVDVCTNEKRIRDVLTFENLEKMSRHLFEIDTPGKREASIGSIWGEFTLSRDNINGGLRFALVECPNALAWTVTTGFPPERESIVIHLTINRKQKQQQFIDEIEDFLVDHSQCLENIFCK